MWSGTTTVPKRRQRRDEPPVEVAPRRLAVQQQDRIARTRLDHVVLLEPAPAEEERRERPRAVEGLVLVDHGGTLTVTLSGAMRPRPASPLGASLSPSSTGVVDAQAVAISCCRRATSASRTRIRRMPGQAHAVVGHPGHLLHGGDLGAGVAPLATVGAGRLHDLLGVQPAHERRLDTEHPRHLPHRVDRRVVVVDGEGQGGQRVSSRSQRAPRSGRRWPSRRSGRP